MTNSPTMTLAKVLDAIVAAGFNGEREFGSIDSRMQPNRDGGVTFYGLAYIAPRRAAPPIRVRDEPHGRRAAHRSGPRDCSRRRCGEEPTH